MAKFIERDRSKIYLPHGMEIKKSACDAIAVVISLPVIVEQCLFQILRRHMSTIIGQTYLTNLDDMFKEDGINQIHADSREIDCLIYSLFTLIPTNRTLCSWRDYLVDEYFKILAKRKAQLSVNDFVNNMLIMTSAILLLKKRPKYKAGYNKRIGRLSRELGQIRKKTKQIQFSIHQLKALVSQIPRAGNTSLYLYDYFEEISALFKKDDMSPDAVLERFRMDLDEQSSQYIDMIDHEIDDYCTYLIGSQNVTGYSRPPDRQITYGTIHWLHKSNRFPLRTACRLIALISILPNTSRDIDWDFENKAKYEEIEKLRTSYLRLVKPKK